MEGEKKGPPNAGIAVLLIKIGPKLISILAKLGASIWAVVKSLFGVKTVGIAGSVGYYTYLFTWQMGVALVLFIGIHEYGHLWAMKRCGIKTKGMFFIPGFGAVAVAEERFGSAKNEVFIALLGPLFGLLFFVAPTLYLYGKTHNGLWAAIASLTTLVNLINLLPVVPLDGGRVMKSVTYSKNYAQTFFIVTGVSLTALLFALVTGVSLLGIMVLVGLFETAREFGVIKHTKEFFTSLARLVLPVVLFFSSTVNLFNHKDVFTFAVSLLFTVMCIIMFVIDVKSLTIKKGYSVWKYPLEVWRSFVKGLREIRDLRKVDIKPIENYTIMSGLQKFGYIFLFLFLIVIHILIILVVSNVPGAGLAKEIIE